MTYKDSLKDPLWQRKRLEILQRDNWTCRACGENKNTLHAHHICYEKGLKAWEYDNESIVTLCDNCHDEIHGKIQKIAAIIAFQIIVNKIDILSLLKGGSDV